MNPYTENKIYLAHYERTIEKAQVQLEKHLQAIEYCKMKPKPYADHVRYKIKKFKRLANLCQDKIDFYKGMIENLNL